MLSLSQRLSQQQKLSPQQIQYQKLLQLNTLALEQRIKTELELNPILEEVMDEEIELTQEKEEKEKEDGADEEFEDSVKEEFELEDFMNDSDFEGDKVNRSKDDEVYQPLAPAKESLTEHLLNQLTMLNLENDLFMLGEEIIGNLDADGYLKRSLEDIVNELEMFDHLKISKEEAETLLKRIQGFDPPGIASRNLQECLLVQLKYSEHDHYFKYLAEQILEQCYDDFTKRRFDAIKQKLNLTDETLKATLDSIQRSLLCRCRFRGP